VSFKFDPGGAGAARASQMFEIFVYSTRFEGCICWQGRAGRWRWSDRPEIFVRRS
jgi:hypothetical protein